MVFNFYVFKQKTSINTAVLNTTPEIDSDSKISCKDLKAGRRVQNKNFETSIVCLEITYINAYTLPFHCTFHISLHYQRLSALFPNCHSTTKNAGWILSTTLKNFPSYFAIIISNSIWNEKIFICATLLHMYYNVSDS